MSYLTKIEVIQITIFDLKRNKYIGRTIFNLFSLVLLVIVGLLAWKFLVPNILNITQPSSVSINSVVEELRNENTLNVLNDTETINYQLKKGDKIVSIFGKEIQIPSTFQDMAINYDFTVHVGIDLSKISENDIKVSGNSLLINLPQPQITSSEISNDHIANSDSGIFALNPNQFDLIKQGNNDYTNTLKEYGLKEVQGKVSLVDSAKSSATNDITDLVQKFNKDLSVNVIFKKK